MYWLCCRPDLRITRGPGQTRGKRLAAERGPHTHRLERQGHFGKRPVWQRQLSSNSERSWSGSSHSTRSGAMGCDPSPATPDPATARPAEEATVYFSEVPGTPREKNGQLQKTQYFAKLWLIERMLGARITANTIFCKTGDNNITAAIFFCRTSQWQRVASTTRTLQRTAAAHRGRLGQRSQLRVAVCRLTQAPRRWRKSLIWCTFCVYVSRGMGYRQPPRGV